MHPFFHYVYYPVAISEMLSAGVGMDAKRRKERRKARTISEREVIFEPTATITVQDCQEHAFTCDAHGVRGDDCAEGTFSGSVGREERDCVAAKSGQMSHDGTGLRRKSTSPERLPNESPRTKRYNGDSPSAEDKHVRHWSTSESVATSISDHSADCDGQSTISTAQQNAPTHSLSPTTLEEDAHCQDGQLTGEREESEKSDIPVEDRGRSHSLIQAAKPKAGRQLRFHPSILLWYAAEDGDIEEMERLLQLLVVEEEEKTASGRSSPYDAAVDYNKATKDGLTLLHLCCFLGDNALECVRLLIELGADTQCCDNDGWTPLTLAVSCNHREIISFLLNIQTELLTRRSSW